MIIGGGPAGVAAALGAKQQDSGAEVVLLNDEPHEPYEKPPLSKAVLMGKAAPLDAPIAGPKRVAGSGVILKVDTRIAAIDRTAHTITSAAGECLTYDVLVFATGSFNRVLPGFPPGQPGLFYLRTEAEARALAARLRESQSLIVIGGGLIGLEVAASAAEIGVRAITVFEVAPRVLARVCDAETSSFIEQYHRARGVDLRLGTALRGRAAGERPAVETMAGEIVAADLIVVGIGAVPDDALAKSAGLATNGGILVDARCRSLDPDIFAAGDCTRFPGPHGPIRLENWRHAQEHGAIAGRNAAGGDASYAVAPSFWSEQFDLYIQGVGWPVANTSARVHRPMSGNARLLFELDGSHIAYAMGINAQRDIAMARRLIERRVPVDPEALADPGKPLAAMLKGRQ
jgi:NADPH-dependent 2,4-dienoyl-CoA reductase/sulfur reductase-like enzyme